MVRGTLTYRSSHRFPTTLPIHEDPSASGVVGGECDNWGGGGGSDIRFERVSARSLLGMSLDRLLVTCSPLLTKSGFGEMSGDAPVSLTINTSCPCLEYRRETPDEAAAISPFSVNSSSDEADDCESRVELFEVKVDAEEVDPFGACDRVLFVAGADVGDGADVWAA